ncbi:SDR family NAD(P)-dependent oxidoreductase [Paraburkholderia phytofirmans]|uniref:SDR family NAD(P)-dependent oxidoreductase n=1 Tax=Paraburkholderia phytofirmans TaxID=261302 RepID=UPI0038BDE3A3
MSAALSFAELFSVGGKTAVVTGAASGIGKATAWLLADAGARVIVADNQIEAATVVASDIGRGAYALGFDLRDDESIARLFADTSRESGSVDILINNAGIYPRYAFDELTEAAWQEMQRVNTWGCFVAMREAARWMKHRGQGGRIINISSIGALRTAVNDQLAYNASKAALDSMTLSAALELAAHNILVNSICPGAVRPLDPKPRPAYHTSPSGPLLAEGRMLLGRPALPAEIAGPILMLASAAGGYITGQTIAIDGGFSLS